MKALERLQKRREERGGKSWAERMQERRAS